ncbi:hypothetical protein [Terriglobus saanensis]|uniref:Thioredoxin domain-containing protein n=1 Tax=Terriglobus saanensis (strain ATCC BAA-1853 / DSM 23119 / SP1PR4) TaxID=401053 RepID=E8V610_TERSS|nr:hypothetical protein [Terriglobus saanensis]ADV83828.1 hypothetical protein AciPR4_3069 [Terriglobus saanensis SP1PR4]
MRVLALAVLLLTTNIPAQEPAPTAEQLHGQLPPSSIYDEIMRPLDATRADVGNWSDTELMALTSAMNLSHTECERLDPAPHVGEELYSYARLCSLGRDWKRTYKAATEYVLDDKAPHRPSAYYLAVQADLNMHHVEDVLLLLKDMDTRLPLTPETNAVYDYVLGLVEFAVPSAGIDAALIRQPKLLEAVSGHNPLLTPGVAEVSAWHLQELLRFDNRVPAEIAGALNDLQLAIAARTAPLTATDAYAAAVAQRRYEAIGKPMPAFDVSRTAGPKTYGAHLSDVNLYVLYPEDCASCASIPEAVAVLRKGLNIRAQAWPLVEVRPTEIKPSPASTPNPKTDPPTLYTHAELLKQLGATAVPFFVLTDGKGNVRLLTNGSRGWLYSDGNGDILAQTMMERIVAHDDNERGAAMDKAAHEKLTQPQ